VLEGVKFNYYVDSGCRKNDGQMCLMMGLAYAENAYKMENFEGHGTLCFTNTPPRTFVRTPGALQSCLFTEMIMDHIAAELDLPLWVVQERNFLHDGDKIMNGQVIENCTIHKVWKEAMERSHFDERYQAIEDYNANNRWYKKGIACCPVKYGLHWGYYRCGVRIGIHRMDGSITIYHSAIEMGQGIHTKVVQAVAMVLGVDISLIQTEKTSSNLIVNAGLTAGSATSELTVQAALYACEELKERIKPYYQDENNENEIGTTTLSIEEWQRLLKKIPITVSLNAEGWSAPIEPNKTFKYFIYAACVSEVELNVLTGEMKIVSCELVYDCGRSLSPAIDMGQIEGALVMGLGYFFTEHVQYEEGTGMLKSVGTWEYKPFLASDIPSVLNVTLLDNAYNEIGVLGSKATGEPPFIASNSAYFALKMAIYSARANAGVKGHFSLPVPATIDQRQQACLVSAEQFALPK
jgi:xanthine dehydrogenase/oxidase